MRKYYFLSICISVGFGQLQAQEGRALSWGVFASFNQSSIQEIYEWRDFLCFEGCSSVGHQPGRSYEVGLVSELKLKKRWSADVTFGYANLFYIEEETWSDGAGFFTREVERTLKNLSLGLGLQYALFQFKAKQQEIYLRGGITNLFNLNERGTGYYTFENTLKNWSQMGEVEMGIKWPIGNTWVEFGPHWRFALSNFAKSREGIRETDFNQLQPQEIGLKLRFLAR
ncbi:MAG: outer membrane beta-barrel protein [Saprospiraceae bacterium]